MKIMIIHASFIIIICFKEIYSWNSIIKNLQFSSYIPHSYYSNKDVRILKKRATNQDNSSEVALTTISSNSLNDSISEDYSTDAPTFNVTSNPVTSPEFTDKSFTDSQKNISSTESSKNLTTTASSIIEEAKKKNETIIIHTPEITSTEIPTNVTSHTITTTENVTSQYIPINSTGTVFEVEAESLHPIHYILIALSIIVILCIIAYGVYHLYRKEQVRRLRLQLMPVYNFDPTESDDWENNLLEEEFSLRSKEKEKANYNTISSL